MNNDLEEKTASEQQLPKGLRKKQRREEKQRQREEAARKKEQQKRFKKIALWGIPLVLMALVGAGFVRSPKNSNPEDPLISRRGIHWHPNLSITIKGEPVTIPANIGVGGAVHKDIHTHKANDTLHVEMNRAVRQDDVRVKNFFDIWGERFTSECILDVCNGEDGTVKMLVNGEENFEFENYLMQEGDRIEIMYAKEQQDS